MNINAYHQPGVEAGKKAAAAILDLQGRVEAILADGVARSADEIRLALGDGTDESIFWILRHLTGNQRGFSAQGDWSPARLDALQQSLIPPGIRAPGSPVSGDHDHPPGS